MKKKLKIHYAGITGRSLCQIENTTRRPVPLDTRNEYVTCTNCRDLGGLKRTSPPSGVTVTHLFNINDAWCERAAEGEVVSRRLSHATCGHCLARYRRRFGQPQGARATRRTSG